MTVVLDVQNYSKIRRSVDIVITDYVLVGGFVVPLLHLNSSMEYLVLPTYCC